MEEYTKMLLASNSDISKTSNDVLLLPPAPLKCVYVLKDKGPFISYLKSFEKGGGSQQPLKIAYSYF